MSDSNHDKKWQELKSACENCTKCELYKTKTNTVFGYGNQKSKLLFVGEAPGEAEDLSGKPFVGASGKLFDKYLAVIGLTREDIYIANILKCRPPKNRDPKGNEQDSCIDFLREQTKLIHPKFIVCLGRIAAMRIIKPDFKITAEHGKWFKKGDYLISAVYHPSAILRDPRRKEDMLCDFIDIRNKLDNMD